MIKEAKNQTIVFKNKPRIIGNYSIAGPKEGKGPFGKMFDYVMKDDFFGEKTKCELRQEEQLNGEIAIGSGEYQNS